MQHPLALNEIHVWHLNADVDDATWATLHATLSDAERLQARQFHFERDKRRFIARRGLIRTALASYGSTSPRDLTFSAGMHGKPLLSSALADRQLHFNYSYSEQQLLLAVSATYEVGIDIEVTRTVTEAREIAVQNFSSTEQQVLVRHDCSTDVFFTCWTAKEAVIKALGSGLSRPLHDFTTLTSEGTLQNELCLHDYDLNRMRKIRLRPVLLRAPLQPVSTSSLCHATLAVALDDSVAEPVIVEQRFTL